MSSQLLVRSMTVESDGVLSIELVDPQGRELPSWEPGAHLDVQLTAGMSRQYSLCGDPHDRLRYRIAVLREPAGRGGSAYVHDVLRPGQLVGYTGPRNHFRLEPSAAYLFIAGGIGITPILPMIARVEAEGARWRLVYGGRTASSMAFTGELAAHRDSVTLHPQDAHGLLDLDALLGTPQPDTLVYCCGPEPLLRAVEERMAQWPAEALHLERFAAPEQPARDPAGEHAVEVVLAESGRTLMVGSGDLDPPGDPGRRHRPRPRLHRGHLRHLRDQGHRRRGRPPRLRADRAREGRRRLHDGLRLPGVREAARAGALGPARTPRREGCGVGAQQRLVQPDLLEQCTRDRPRQRLQGGGVVLQGAQRLATQPRQLRSGDAATALLFLLGLAGDDDLVEERRESADPLAMSPGLLRQRGHRPAGRQLGNSHMGERLSAAGGAPGVRGAFDDAPHGTRAVRTRPRSRLRIRPLRHRVPHSVGRLRSVLSRTR